MMIQGLRGQIVQTPLFDFSGTITLGGTAQRIIRVAQSRSYLLLQNIAATDILYFEFGSARASATVTSGAISACTVTNGGFGFTYPPLIEFIGGGSGGSTQQLGSGQPGYPAPGWSGGGGMPSVAGDRPAQAHCVLTAGVVTSIVIDDPGAGYVTAPHVFIRNSPLDPMGCANPFFGSVPSGIQLLPSGSAVYESSSCPTDQIAVYGATTGSAFTGKYLP